MSEPLRRALSEIRALVIKAQAALDDRPVLQATLAELREKVTTVEVKKPD